MSAPKPVEDLLNKLQSILPESTLDSMQDSKRSLEKELKLIAQEFLSGLDVVSREEFDIQTKVLAKTRMKTEELRQQVEALEKVLKSRTN